MSLSQTLDDDGFTPLPDDLTRVALFRGYLGPLLVANAANTFLTAVVCCQCVSYAHEARDAWPTRLLVAASFLAVSASLLLGWAALWQRVIDEAGLVDALYSYPSTQLAQHACRTVVQILVQGYFLGRVDSLLRVIHKGEDRPRLRLVRYVFTSLLALLIGLSNASGFAILAYHSQGHPAAVPPAWHVSMLLAQLDLDGAALANVLIAATLSRLLMSYGNRTTSPMIPRLLSLTICTGTAQAVCSIAGAVAYSCSKSTSNAAVVFTTTLAPVYCSAMLLTLNSRTSIKRASKALEPPTFYGSRQPPSPELVAAQPLDAHEVVDLSYMLNQRPPFVRKGSSKLSKIKVGNLAGLFHPVGTLAYRDEEEGDSVTLPSQWSGPSSALPTPIDELPPRNLHDVVEER